MKAKSKRLGFYIELTEFEDQVVHKLKKEYAVNISQLLKNYLIDYYKKMESGEGKNKKINT